MSPVCHQERDVCRLIIGGAARAMKSLPSVVSDIPRCTLSEKVAYNWSDCPVTILFTVMGVIP